MIYEQQLKSKSLCHGNAMDSGGHTAQLHVAHASSLLFKARVILDGKGALNQFAFLK